MKIILFVVLAVLLTGCASADIIKALAKDNASACIVLDASLYGGGIYCRTNTPGEAVIKASKGGVEIQHRGK